MTPIYKTKDMTVKAFRVNIRHTESSRQWPNWFIDAFNANRVRPNIEEGVFYLPEIDLIAGLGDWIVLDVDGDLPDHGRRGFPGLLQEEEAEGREAEAS